MRKTILFMTVFFAYAAMAAPELVPIQEKALGQSLAGADTLNDSLYSNPAGVAFTSIYSVEGSYYGGDQFSASIVDTKTSTIGGGIAYYRVPDGLGNMNQGLKLSLLRRVSPTVAVGAAGKLLWGQNEFGDKKNLKDVDIGALAHYQTIQFGGFIRNLFGGDPSYRDQVRELVVGGRINYEQTMFFSVSAHTGLENFDPYQLGIGVEYQSPYLFSIKGGFRTYFDTPQSYWSVGAGINSGRFGIQFAMEFPTLDTESNEYVLSMNFFL